MLEGVNMLLGTSLSAIFYMYMYTVHVLYVVKLNVMVKNERVVQKTKIKRLSEFASRGKSAK